MMDYSVKPPRGTPAAVYIVPLPSGWDGEFRCYNMRDPDGIAYIYEKDKRWYIAGVDPVGVTRNGKFAGLQTAPARLKPARIKGPPRKRRPAAVAA
ncbi:hypothetical protein PAPPERLAPAPP_03250 [Brevundimonas phage vB_BpoS-Papperlapapp]|uniref:Uncharacterized protein n=1 Tax=Brevundimonas phage vB_BpoS-Domovoi TaxID=2948598 RepID=A0A9E7SKN2_9CAUD|nr:hypothetical protein DOMOVOI_02200 [Brevundimonas phage vB_BpoS-Domovoi]USN16066.1 hypothetical protein PAPPERLAPAPP_03250 [Brevundimonas phage vB_BpoS-Papperlapapp]